MAEMVLTGWIGGGEDDRCPKCGVEVEYFDDGEEILAERCSLCRWQINMNPQPHRVSFGTNPEED